MSKLATAVILATLSTPTIAQNLPQLDGVWASDGYGMLAEIQNGRVMSYQYAGDVCIPESRRPQRLSSLLDGAELSLSQDGSTMVLSPEHAFHPMRVNRLAGLPLACTTPPQDTPEGNFEAFATFFRENYGFFDLYGVDWDARVASARTELRPDMTDAELFSLFARLMAPLQDGHLKLSGGTGRQRMRYKPNPGVTHERLEELAEERGVSAEGIVDEFRRTFWEDGVGTTVLAGAGVEAGNGRIQYGVIDGDVGYIALFTVAGYRRNRPDVDRDMAAINDVMEDALRSFQEANVRSVIVDLSMNFGGFDVVALEIAGRFADAPHHAITKYPVDADTPIRTDITVYPSTGTRFLGPVTVLTSDVTVSAAEILTLALRSLPNVTHAGETTRGAMSDVLDRTLPNGWELSLSNEVYLDHTGRSWEGRGIQPERAMVVFSASDPIASHAATVLELASR